MTFHIELTQREVYEKIPFPIVVEAVEGAVWNTGKRRRMQKEWFTDKELHKLSDLKKLAHRWYFTTGVPRDGVRMSVETYQLWQKFCLFCSLI